MGARGAAHTMRGAAPWTASHGVEGVGSVVPRSAGTSRYFAMYSTRPARGDRLRSCCASQDGSPIRRAGRGNCLSRVSKEGRDSV